MELERTFTVTLSPNDARRRVESFLSAAGFAMVDGGNPLVFRRSNRLRSLFATAPDGMLAVVTIAIRRHGSSHSQLRVQYAISTFGQLVTDADRAFFDAELAELEAALGGEASDAPVPVESRSLADAAYERNKAIAERRTTLEASGVDPRVVGALALLCGAGLAGMEYFSLPSGEYEPKALLAAPPAVLVGFFQLLAGNPERDADGGMPRWWKAGRAFAIGAGLVLSAVLFYQLG